MQRRDLFNLSRFFDKEVKSTKILLPYIEDKNVLQSCLTCDHHSCVLVCPTQIIVIDDEERIPILDFSKDGCTYCAECKNVCDKGVLNNSEQKIDALFSINMLACLSWNQTMCFSCKDRCLANAISFIGLFRPSINHDLCTACGFCVGVCPTKSITIEVKN